MWSAFQVQVDPDALVEWSADPHNTDFQCAVCLGIVRDPVATPCEHFYCRQCLTGVDACPECRTALTELHGPGRRFLRALGAFALACPVGDGCAAELRLENLNAHLAVCPRLRVHCENGCGVEELPREFLADHLLGCPRRLELCDYCASETEVGLMAAHVSKCVHAPFPCKNGCAAVVSVATAAAHRDECPSLVIDCSVLGCGASLPRSEMPRHLEKAVGAHVVCMGQQHQQEVATLRAEVTACQHRLEVVEMHAHATEQRLAAAQQVIEGLTLVLASKPALGSPAAMSATARLAEQQPDNVSVRLLRAGTDRLPPQELASLAALVQAPARQPTDSELLLLSALVPAEERTALLQAAAEGLDTPSPFVDMVLGPRLKSGPQQVRAAEGLRARGFVAKHLWGPAAAEFARTGDPDEAVSTIHRAVELGECSPLEASRLMGGWGLIPESIAMLESSRDQLDQGGLERLAELTGGIEGLLAFKRQAADAAVAAGTAVGADLVELATSLRHHGDEAGAWQVFEQALEVGPAAHVGVFVSFAQRDIRGGHERATRVAEVLTRVLSNPSLTATSEAIVRAHLTPALITLGSPLAPQSLEREIALAEAGFSLADCDRVINRMLVISNKPGVMCSPTLIGRSRAVAQQAQAMVDMEKAKAKGTTRFEYAKYLWRHNKEAAHVMATEVLAQGNLLGVPESEWRQLQVEAQ